MSFAADLNTVWFVLVGVLLTGYAMLDGFDLGVGALHLLVREDRERRLFINAIGPVWDGNEVWLVTGGGALFAAFPVVYARVFSGFYLVFMLLLFMLIFRAVAIEFRSKLEAAWWRRLWDRSFALGSVGAALLVGVALGNMAWGVAVTAEGQLDVPLVGLLHPYALLVGATTLALFAMHGCIYLVLKLDGALQEKVRGWVRPTIIAFILCYVFTTLVTLLYVPHMTTVLQAQPAWLAVPLLNVLAIADIPREIHRGREFRAFLASCASMALLMALFGLGMYPELVHARGDAALSLTAYNAASSAGTLRIMLIIAALGVPLVLAYTASIYWVFRGKVRLDENSY